MAALDPSSIMNELNLDDTTETTQLISDLTSQAEDIILHSVDSTKAADDFIDNLIWQRAVITLVTQLYYDRTLANGMSLGLQMMINHLKGEVSDDDTTATTTTQN